jgi:endonuclease-3
MKRAPSTRLAARVSSNDPSETLFEVEEESHRQSKRVKLDNLRRFKLTSSTSTTVPDLEDGIQRAESSEALMSKRSSRSNVRTKGTKPPPKHKRIQQSLDTPHPAPAKWGEVYDMIKSMRALELAPVDTMGCQLAGTPETDPVVIVFLL